MKWLERLVEEEGFAPILTLSLSHTHTYTPHSLSRSLSISLSLSHTHTHKQVCGEHDRRQRGDGPPLCRDQLAPRDHAGGPASQYDLVDDGAFELGLALCVCVCVCVCVRACACVCMCVCVCV